MGFGLGGRGKINEEIISVAVPRLSSGNVILPKKGQGRDAWKWMGGGGRRRWGGSEWVSVMRCEGSGGGGGRGWGKALGDEVPIYSPHARCSLPLQTSSASNPH